MEKLKILVCTHKESSYTKTNPPYFPIQAGKSLNPALDLGFQTDNTGDNISEKNSTLNEFTVLYWAWKNLKNVEYIGLCHYRRYFKKEINEDNIDRLLKGKDIIVPYSGRFTTSHGVYKELCYATSQEEFWIYVDTVLSLYPDSEQAIINLFFCNNRYPVCSMFVARKEILDEWCSFLFPILGELEKKFKQHPYWRQNRAIGYFGEFSLGVFIEYKKLRVKEIDKYNIPVSKKKYSLVSYLQQIRKGIILGLQSVRVKPMKKLQISEQVKVGFEHDGIKLENF